MGNFKEPRNVLANFARVRPSGKPPIPSIPREARFFARRRKTQRVSVSVPRSPRPSATVHFPFNSPGVIR